MELFSRYESGLQFTAGTMTGSYNGVSGINPIIDRLNSISTADNLVTGSFISGTSTNIITPYQDTNSWIGSMVSGTTLEIYASGGDLGVATLWEIDGTETQLRTADEIDMQSKKIINVTNPITNQDAATKKYVDDIGAVKVTGPVSSTDNAIARFNLTTGKIIQNSTPTITDTGNLDMHGDDILDVNDIYLDDINAQGTNIYVRDHLYGALNDLGEADTAGRWDRLYIQDIYLYSFMDPTIDNNVQLGTGSKRYSNIYTVTLTEGDHVYQERGCLLCDEKFKEGEAIVNYVLSNTEEGTRTIPAHLKCVVNEETDKQKHSNVIKKLKVFGKYISPGSDILERQRIMKKQEELRKQRQSNKKQRRQTKDL